MSGNEVTGNPANAISLVGVTQVDHSLLLAEQAVLKTEIPLLTQTSLWDLTTSGKIEDSTAGSLTGSASLTFSMTPGDGKLLITVTLDSGLNVIDFTTNNQDLTMTNMTLVIDGPDDSSVIFRTNEFDNIDFIVTQANILAGLGLGDLNSVLFYADGTDKQEYFFLNQSVVNGVAFWSLGMGGGEIHFNDVQGCTQLVADKIQLDGVRLSRCGYGELPEPSSLTMTVSGFAMLGIFALYRRRKVSQS